VILAASHYGYRLDTHVISARDGRGRRQAALGGGWGVAGNIVAAWVLTIPAAGSIGAAVTG